ncbi:MAG: phosphoadenosine phosphosulfate reductase family protein, partial [Paraclostridium sp.]
MTMNELKTMQNYPLELKIMKTQQRIREWVSEYGEDGVYVAFSGGKDSTVLMHIVRELYPSVEGVFANTGNEFPEIVQFVRKQENIKWVRPRKSFAKIIREEGYPIISKKTSRMLKDLKNPHDGNAKSRKLYLSDYALDINGNLTEIKNNSFKLAKKHRYLINSPFNISNKCCDYLKKYPMQDYEKISGKKPIIGTQANESKMRESAYLQTGCNNFKGGKCQPLGFWTEQDVLEYIVKFNIELSPIYGAIKQDGEGKYYTTGETRTGCSMCLYGCSMWRTDEDNRVLRMEKTHPKLHNHMINNLGFKEVLEFMNIKYTSKINDEIIKEKVKLGDEEVEQLKWII